MIVCFLEYNWWLILDLWNSTKRPENREQSEKLYWNIQIKCEKCLEIFFTYSKLYKDLYELCNMEVGWIHSKMNKKDFSFFFFFFFCKLSLDTHYFSSFLLYLCLCQQTAKPKLLVSHKEGSEHLQAPPNPHSEN